MIAAANGVVIPANFWGKLKSVSQMTFTFVIMLLGEVQGLLQTYAADFAATLPDNLLSLISNGLLWITAILTVISGAIYIKDSKNVIDYTK